MPKLLEQVRTAIRVRHYSYRTEKTYIHWIKQYIFFSNKQHPGGAVMSDKRRIFECRLPIADFESR